MAHIAIVGATGLVGQHMLESLEILEINVDKLTLYASINSEGRTITFKNQTYTVKALNDKNIDDTIDYALFSAGATTALKYAKKFISKGIKVIDNSSAYRADLEVPLVVPEVNAMIVNQTHTLISNPNCSTIQSVIPLHVIHQLYGIKRVNYTTYQAVSGSGQAGINALQDEVQSFYPKAINKNVIPQIDSFLENGYTKEEQKMMDETRKILNLPKLKVSATCVRVPVVNGHSVSISIECKRPINIPQLENAFVIAKGIQFYKQPNYPTPKDVDGKNEVHIGRLRKDISDSKTVHLWCVADNLRKGAAFNAVQILKQLMEERR